MIKKIFFFLLSSLHIFPCIAQDSLKSFRWNLFRYNDTELPFTIGVGPMSGIGNHSSVVGLSAEADVYHIMISYVIKKGIPFPGDIKFSDNSFLFGYMYRRKSVMVSAGLGFGKQTRRCTEDRTYYNCIGHGQGTFDFMAYKFEIHYVFTPFTSVNVGFYINNDPLLTLGSFMIGIKGGFFREPHK